MIVYWRPNIDAMKIIKIKSQSRFKISLFCDK
jgi:hypothetical protein